MPYANLAEHMDDQGRYDEAVRLLQKSIELCPSWNVRDIRYFEMQRKLGFLYMEHGKYSLASDQFEIALSLRPLRLPLSIWAGMALASLGNFLKHNPV